MSTGAKKMAKRNKTKPSGKNKLSTFTYYIPAPPHRKSGYREKEFDKILTGILDSGFEIVSLQTQGVGNENGAGLFIIAVLRSPSVKVRDLDRDHDIQDRFRLATTHANSDIILEEDEYSDEI